MFSRIAFSSLLVASAMGASKDYSQNGANWGETDPLCKDGVEQSPINLTTTGVSTSNKMKLNGFGYQNMVVKTADAPVDGATNLNGKGTFHLNFADGTMSSFNALQFHFHAPSEHTIENQ